MQNLVHRHKEPRNPKTLNSKPETLNFKNSAQGEENVGLRSSCMGVVGVLGGSGDTGTRSDLGL